MTYEQQAAIERRVEESKISSYKDTLETGASRTRRRRDGRTKREGGRRTAKADSSRRARPPVVTSCLLAYEINPPTAAPRAAPPSMKLASGEPETYMPASSDSSP